MTNKAKLLNSKQAAQMLGVHPHTIRDWAEKGRIPAVKAGRVWRFDLDALRAWSSREQEPVVSSVVDADVFMRMRAALMAIAHAAGSLDEARRIAQAALRDRYSPSLAEEGGQNHDD